MGLPGQQLLLLWRTPIPGRGKGWSNDSQPGPGPAAGGSLLARGLGTISGRLLPQGARAKSGFSSMQLH